MPIDPSIALNLRAPQAATDPLDQYAKVMTIKGLMSQDQLQGLQIRKATQDDADEQALRELAPQAGGDVTKLRDLVYNRGLFKQGMALDKQLLEQKTKEADIRAKLANASKDEIEANSKKFTLLNGAGLAAINAYQEARAKKLPEEMAIAVAQPAYEAAMSNLAQSGLFDEKFLSGIPRNFDPIRTKAALSQTLPYEKFLEDERARRGQDMTAATAVRGQDLVADVGRERNAVTARGQDIGAQTAREGHGVTMRGQNMADARAKDQIALGGRTYDADRGLVVNTREGTAAPVMQDGAPIGQKPNKPNEQYLKQQTGVQNVRNAITDYREALKGWGTLDAINPQARAKMGTLYNNMLLQAKEAYNLGVLNGPDYKILTDVVADPATPKGMVTTNATLDEQAQTLDRIMGKIGQTSAAVHGQPEPRTAPATPAGRARGGTKFLGFENP